MTLKQLTALVSKLQQRIKKLEDLTLPIKRIGPAPQTICFTPDKKVMKDIIKGIKDKQKNNGNKEG